MSTVFEIISMIEIRIGRELTAEEFNDAIIFVEGELIKIALERQNGDETYGR